jgi:hypothetical protein
MLWRIRSWPLSSNGSSTRTEPDALPWLFGVLTRMHYRRRLVIGLLARSAPDLMVNGLRIRVTLTVIDMLARYRMRSPGSRPVTVTHCFDCVVRLQLRRSPPDALDIPLGRRS